MLRAAPSALRAIAWLHPSRESIRTTACEPRAASLRAWSMTGSTAAFWVSSEAAKLTAASGATGPCDHSEISSGRAPGEHDVDHVVRVAGQGSGDPPERLGLA